MFEYLISNFSKEITNLIITRIEKNYDGLNKEGEVIFIESLEELNLTNNKEEWMFLSRNRCFLKPIEEFVKSKGMIYRKYGELSIKQDEIKIPFIINGQILCLIFFLLFILNWEC